MKRLGLGVIPDFAIRDLIRSECIGGFDGYGADAIESLIGADTLDLPFAAGEGSLFVVSGFFNLIPGQSVEDAIKDTAIGASPVRWGSPFMQGAVYLAKLLPAFELPEGFYGFADLRSGAARDTAKGHLLSDGEPILDRIPGGRKVSVWLQFTYTSMSVGIVPENGICQVRLFNHHTRLSASDLKRVHEVSPVLLDASGPVPDLPLVFGGDSFGMRIDLSPGKRVGWRCIGNNRVVNHSVQHRAADFFEPIIIDSRRRCWFRKGEFYLLSTLDRLRVPPLYAAEMKPISLRITPAQVHAAAYFMPGWGYGENGEGVGDVITLEFYPDRDVVLADGQIIAEVRLERMAAIPERHYGQRRTSFGGQASAIPSKRFTV